MNSTQLAKAYGGKGVNAENLTCVLASLRLGKQVPQYKMAKKTLYQLIGELKEK